MTEGQLADIEFEEYKNKILELFFSLWRIGICYDKIFFVYFSTVGDSFFIKYLHYSLIYIYKM